jgi:protein-S-isoprenylcysteine O-methyltransferase Ste14
MKLFLGLRSLLFLVLIPGTVAGYIPWRLLRTSKQLAIPALSISSSLAAGLALLGICALLVCVWDFFEAGRGTLAPFDPPRLLVVRGLYRLTRNPMYNGVVVLLAAEAWFFQSTTLIEYALVVFLIFHLMVVVYEEPALEQQFGDSYRAYRAAVPRWGFTVRPFAGQRAEDS